MGFHESVVNRLLVQAGRIPLARGLTNTVIVEIKTLLVGKDLRSDSQFVELKIRRHLGVVDFEIEADVAIG